ncbi:hypothetical protein Ddye_027935 [Dipteronia dyeriana]|uniref:RNase H type-1 domain-containing protein n=1 Tax=Dipteronia dyeriana TaxID=168575 RepID=A0AAD9WRW9_9ROSI|nr:hypothetical protein Ddye_027935 [Dipteronia dyeriana]
MTLILNNTPLCHPLFNIIHACKSLMGMDWSFYIQHVYRESNKVADRLANLGHSLKLGTIVFDHTPSQLLKFGKKNNSSSTGDRSAESDNVIVNGSEVDVVVTATASAREVQNLLRVEMKMKMVSDGYVPLFETNKFKGRVMYRLFSVSIFIGISFILAYRVGHIPGKGADGKWAWIGLFAAELWFSFYWLCTQALRWNCVYKRTFKDRLSQRRAAKLGRLSEEQRSKHKGFSQWETYSSKQDHDTILQILIDGRDGKARDIEGCSLPTLVYLAREKKPQHPHNFKAGAMNALIRVSGKISNGKIIHNVDCDMYSNNSKSVRDALCFFMDEEKGQEVAFVQFSESFQNVTKNEIYGSSFRVAIEVEFHGMDGNGGPPYIGTGCFHRRDTLCGRKFGKECTST